MRALRIAMVMLFACSSLVACGGGESSGGGSAGGGSAGGGSAGGGAAGGGSAGGGSAGGGAVGGGAVGGGAAGGGAAGGGSAGGGSAGGGSAGGGSAGGGSAGGGSAGGGSAGGGSAVNQDAGVAATDGLAFFAHFDDVAFVNNRFVALGDQGATATSTDGLTWDFSFLPTTEHLNGITFFQNKYVVVGDGGGVFTSSGDDVWVRQDAGAPLAYRDITSSPTTAVAVGSALRSSNDGIVWSQSTFALNGYQPRSVAWGNGRFVAVAVNNSSGTMLLTSTDGTTWTQVSTLTGAMESVKWLTNGFYAAGFQRVAFLGAAPPLALGNLVYSGEAENFAIAEGAGRKVTVGKWGRSTTSPDGGAFALSPGWYADSTLRGLAYGNGAFVAVGEDGTIVRSTDGLAWSDVLNGVATQYSAMAHGAGRFVAMGGNTGNPARTLTSTDGLNWSFGQRVGTNVSFSEGQFLVASLAGRVSYSSDGLTFTNAQTPNYYGIQGVVRGPDRLLAVGSFNEMSISPDGGAWSKVDGGAGTRGYQEGLYAAGRYVVTGQAAVYTSTDGLVWSKPTLPGNLFETFVSIAHVGGNFVVPGRAQVFTSPDGVTWASTPQPQFNLDGKMFFDGTQLVMSRAQPWLFTSPDGVNWTMRDGGFDSPGNLERGAFNGSTYAFAGGNAKVVATTNLSDFFTFNASPNGTITALTGLPDGGGLATVESGFVALANAHGAFPTNSGLARGFRRRAAVANGIIVASGITSSNNESPQLAVSTNGGLSWSKPLLPERAEGTVGFVAGKFRVRGRNAMFSSTDGVTWAQDNTVIGEVLVETGNIVVGLQGTGVAVTEGSAAPTFIPVPGGNYRDLAVGPTGFCMVGDDGAIATSPDGKVWTTRSLATTADFAAVAPTGLTGWVAAGSQGLVATSKDGVNWERRSAPVLDYRAALTTGGGVLVGGARGAVLRFTP